MITLTKEIQKAIKDSQEDPVRLVDPETKVEYVVLPVEICQLPKSKDLGLCEAHAKRPLHKLNGFLQ